MLTVTEQEERAEAVAAVGHIEAAAAAATEVAVATVGMIVAVAAFVVAGPVVSYPGPMEGAAASSYRRWSAIGQIWNPSHS